MDIKRLFGQRLALAQEMRGLSREQLAEQLSVHPTYVSKLQRGEVNVGIETVKRVSDALGFPMAFFLEENYTVNLGEALPKPRRQRGPAKTPARR